MLKRLAEIYPEREEVRREIAGDYEARYRKFREKRNIAGQEEMLRELIKLVPRMLNSRWLYAIC